MSCPLTEQLRRSTWPTKTTLEEKLWGTREELHSTASLIEETSVKVYDFGIRKKKKKKNVLVFQTGLLSLYES